MKKYLFLFLLLFLAGCGSEQSSCEWETNQKERQRIFKECMQILPAGPESTKYNDWNEVVSECDDVAYWQAREEICK